MLGLLGVVACGGRTIEEPGSGGVDTSPSDPTATDAGSTSSGKGGNTSKPGSLPTTQLGQCHPGFERAKDPTRPCRFRTESGMCFDTSDAACACICPMQGESVCAHGFDDGPYSATLVVCD